MPWPGPGLALLALLVAYGALAPPALEAHPPPETATRPATPPEPEPPRPQPEAHTVAEPRAYLLYLDYDRDPIVVDAYREEEGEIVFEKYGGQIKIPRAQVLEIVPDRPDLPPGPRPRGPAPSLLSEGFTALRRRAAASHYLSLRSGGNLKVSGVRPEGGRLRVILEEGSFTIPASEVVGILRLPADGEGWPEAWLVVKREGERAAPAPPLASPPEPARELRRAAPDEWPAPPPSPVAEALPEAVPAPEAVPDGGARRAPRDEWPVPAPAPVPAEPARTVAALPQTNPEPPPAQAAPVEPARPAAVNPDPVPAPAIEALPVQPVTAPAATPEPAPPHPSAPVRPAPAPAAAPEPPRPTPPAQVASLPPSPIPARRIFPPPAPAGAPAAPPPFTVAALPREAPPEPPKVERILPSVSSSTKPHLLEMASGETIQVKGFWIEEGQLKFRRFGGMVGIALSEVLKLVPEEPEPSGERVPARFVRLLGPTLLEVRVKAEGRRVRLLGIEALASLDRAREPWRGLQRGDVLQLEFDRERGTGEAWLAYVFLASGRMLNAELVRLGLARPAVDPRALKYVDLFHELGGRPTQDASK